MTSNRRTYVIDLDFSIQIWEAGFNKIVVDVKPVEGDVLYKSEFMTQATTIGSVNVRHIRPSYLQ